MSGLRNRRLHVANTLGLACIAATCFLAACGEDDDGANGATAGADSGGSSGKAGSGGKAGASSAGNGGSEDNAGEGGEENVGGSDSGEGGEGGDAGATAGSGGSTAGSGGSTAGSGGSGGSTAGSGGSGGAAPVLVPNCARDNSSGRKVEISTSGNDGLYGAAHAADGKLYATGFVQSGTLTTEDRKTVVVRLTAAGALDTTWNGDGIVEVNVKAMTGTPGQGELPRGIAFQGDKIIVAGTVEAYTTAQTTEPVLNNDRDVYVLRLNADGSLDTTFGDVATPGIHILPLSQGLVTTNATTGMKALSGADQQWGLNVLADGKIIVTAATRNAGATRADTDFAVVRLTADGAQDTTFGLGATGIYTLDIAQAGASVRTASVLDDGKLIITGYSTYAGTQRPVIFKLLADGSALDTSFGSVGVFSEPVGTAAEAYGALVQTGGKLVTVGYGRATSATPATDILSIRLTANGLLDTTYGVSGRSWFDVYGLGDNGRAIVLSDNRPVLLGGGTVATGQQDAVITLLSIDGAPITTFGSPYGCIAYDFGSVGDFFWAGDVAADGKISAVGLTGHASGSSEDTDGIFVQINKP